MPNPTRIYGEGNLFDVSENTTIRGARQDKLILQPGSTEEPDELGVNCVKRRWWCRRDKSSEFRPREGDIDFLYRDLGYWRHKVTHGGAGAYIDTWFNGFID